MHARTLRIFRLYQLFNGIIFTGPVWAVYLLSRGLTLTTISVLTSLRPDSDPAPEPAVPRSRREAGRRCPSNCLRCA